LLDASSTVLEKVFGKKKARNLAKSGFLLEFGSSGWIRTSDQRINSPLRYRCATEE
jgi:hypothetical protein